MNLRADLYALLAELLAEPPDWMFLPGREWPLYETLTGLTSESETARRHLDLVAGIPTEPHDQRLERYTAIFVSGRPRFWLYESAARTGKILGPQAFEMARLYHAVGMEATGAELPDHISLELSFLSYLAGQDDPSYEKQFLEKCGDWMIDLGRALAQSGDEVYAPIGALLADWLTERMKPAQSATVTHNTLRNTLLPVILRADDCTLCGFCAQVCPTRALKVMQDAESNFLSLNSAGCIHCGKCECICEFHALKMSLPALNAGADIVLRQSPHALCKTCGKPIASQAEMNYIVSQIGDASWQHLCLDCRAYAIR